MKKIVRIASRRSALAMWQAEHVRSELEKRNPDRTFEIVKIVTSGDKILDVPLARIGSKGLFTKEIEQSLLDGESDLAVHSMKDVPTELPPELEIAVITKREKPQDAIITRSGCRLEELPRGAVVGTSSLRRRAQLLNMRPDLVLKDLRGNLDTRMRKLHEEDYDAVIVAAAGVIRLGKEELITEVLPPETSLPAVGQGSLGIEIRRDDEETRRMVAFLDDPASHRAIAAERALLHTLEGGCQIPIGAYATLQEDGSLELLGIVASLDGERLIKDSISGPADEAEGLGIALAGRLYAAGGKEILEEIRGMEGPDACS